MQFLIHSIYFRFAFWCIINALYVHIKAINLALKINFEFNILGNNHLCLLSILYDLPSKEYTLISSMASIAARWQIHCKDGSIPVFYRKILHIIKYTQNLNRHYEMLVINFIKDFRSVFCKIYTQVKSLNRICTHNNRILLNKNFLQFIFCMFSADQINLIVINLFIALRANSLLVLSFQIMISFN